MGKVRDVIIADRHMVLPSTDRINEPAAKRFRRSPSLRALNAIGVALFREEKPPVSGILHLARPGSDKCIEEA